MQRLQQLLSDRDATGAGGGGGGLETAEAGACVGNLHLVCLAINLELLSRARCVSTTAAAQALDLSSDPSTC